MTSMPTLWKDVLAETDLFAGLDAALLADLGFEERAVAAGEHLVRQGDRAEGLFVVLAGRLEVVLDEHADLELDALGPGSIVGEIALMVGGTRSATVRATEPTRVLALSRERFDAARTRHPGIAEALAGPLQARLRRIAAARHLQEVLGALDAATLREVEREAQWRHLASGEVLFRKGDAADGAYLVVAVGRLRVVMEEAGEERVIDEVGPGQWVGEMALLTGQPRSATVYAVRDTELLWLSDAVFHRLIVKDPRALLETSRRLVARLQRQMGPERQVRAQLRSLAVVPTHGGVDVSAFAAQLASVLSGYGAVLHLSAAEVDRRLGQPGIANAAPTDPAHLRLAPWLVEQERQHRFVVYEAEPTASAFTERALRHADHVLLVADSARSSRSSPAITPRAAASCSSRPPSSAVTSARSRGSRPARSTATSTCAAACATTWRASSASSPGTRSASSSAAADRAATRTSASCASSRSSGSRSTRRAAPASARSSPPRPRSA